MTLDCERLLQYGIELVTRPVVRGQKSVAKFHAVSLTYKKTLFETFLSQSAAAKASRKADEFDMGENKVATGRLGLFARFPFLKVEFLGFILFTTKFKSGRMSFVMATILSIAHIHDGSSCPQA